jgi:hypothetical protein
MTEEDRCTHQKLQQEKEERIESVVVLRTGVLGERGEIIMRHWSRMAHNCKRPQEEDSSSSRIGHR